MILACDLKKWISDLPDSAQVHIDDGGLTWVAIDPDAPAELYIEVGGEPQEGAYCVECGADTELDCICDELNHAT